MKAASIGSCTLSLLLLLTACDFRADRSDGQQPTTENQITASQTQQFCNVLNQINNGNIDTDGLKELQGHALVLKQLLDAAPNTIVDDMKTFYNVFAGWAAAVDGDNPMRETFAALTDTQLIGAEGRVGDFIAEHCGLRLGNGYYNEAPRPTAQSICPAWPGLGSPQTFNNFPNLPDISGANYFANYFTISRLGFSPADSFAVQPGGWAIIRGQYPRSRYFSYHPNDMDLNNLPTMRDRDLDPDAGSVNPFRQQPENNNKNYYTYKLVFGPPPENPEPNTRYVGVKKDGVSKNRFVFNMLRLYASDIGDGANSGGVPLPALTIYKANGEVDQHFDECDLYANGGDTIKTDIQFPSLPIADHRARAIPQWSTSSNFEAPSDTLANADVQYLSTVYSERFGDLFVVRAKALTAPNTRAGVPVSSEGFDTRLYTFCTYNIWAGHAIDCMLDNELAIDDQGFYTLVISRQNDRPKNLNQQQATWMDWGVFLDGQLAIRHVYRENKKVQSVVKGLRGEALSQSMQAYVPIAKPCTREQFERAGWRGCLE